ncbi:MAG: DNA internalization-related competence protein ComEC/Rec2 [Clostridium sp.]|nr:DNA internalization-related competence protein ComEC/Rec2 [Clostridium sp.]MCM1443953.1 DNA internalization-related competence protein ComEC/Rec2 [Candidatus Amulumruptor caecigallinarius]
MKKLKITLLFKIFLIFVVFIRFIYCFKNIDNTKNIENEFICTIQDISTNGNTLTLEVMANQKLVVKYYVNESDYENIISLKVGDIIKVSGEISIPNKNTNFNLFNYKNYLLSKNIHYICIANKITFLKSSDNILYNLKNGLINYIDKFKSHEYLHSFILGENDLIDEDVINSYRQNGISHLFAVSGMHVTLVSGILLFIINKFIKNKKINYIMVSIVLFVYVFITNFQVSIVRAFLLFSSINISKSFNIKIKNIDILLFILCILLIYNPFYIYNIGFLFSFIISITLILSSKYINSYKSYFSKLFITSLISYLISIPILVNNFFEINLLTPFLNLLFVPLVSIIIFPLSIICLIFPILDNLLHFLINIMENISLFLNNFNFLKIILSHINIIGIIIYYLIIIFVIYKILFRKYQYIFLIFILVFIHSNINYLNSYSKLTMLDVGQGDSILIELPHNKGNILIDTGGKVNFNSKYLFPKKDYSLAIDTIIPYLKSSGVKKIDYLVISHGDYDHMGEAINLVNNFKVEKVIFNCGSYNNLENELIKVLDNKKIEHYSCINELNIDNNKLYFLNIKEYANENDNSSVVYTELNNYKFLFMGDAGKEKEKDILEKYKINNIDILKVGHHGSKTSSCKEFVNDISPKYSIISVGENNRYGHPNKETLENLGDSKIYRTDIDGSIMFKIKKNKLEIETCTS